MENAVTGPAYKVVDMKTGKEIKNLVNFDRLKMYYPEKKSDVNSAGCDNILPEKNKFAPAECIIRDKVNNGIHLFLVVFKDKSRHWCKSVGEGSLRDYWQKKRR